MKKPRRILFIILWLASLIPAAAEACSQTPMGPSPSPLLPGIGIQVQASPKIGTVGDPINIFVDISMPAGYTVEIPKLDKQAGDFSILDFNPGTTREEAPQSPANQRAKRLHHRVQILAAIYKTGSFTFPSLQIKFKTAEDKEAIAASSPIAIEIRSVLTEKDPRLKDMKKQAEIPEPIRWALWIGIILAITTLAIILWFLRKRKRPATAKASRMQVQDMLELAEADLRTLIACGLPAAGMEKQFYIQLSEIAKRILEFGYEVPAIEQTTEEIMDSLKDNPSADSEIAHLISSFLLSCDVVKFAKYVPSKAEQEIAVKNAILILDQAKNSRQQPVGSKELQLK